MNQVKLTTRELEFLKLFAQGKAPTMAGIILHTTRENASNYKARLQKKGFRFDTMKQLEELREFLRTYTPPEPPAHPGLTPRVLAIFRHYLSGMNYQEVADTLGLKASTVETTISSWGVTMQATQTPGESDQRRRTNMRRWLTTHGFLPASPATVTLDPEMDPANY